MSYKNITTLIMILFIGTIIGCAPNIKSTKIDVENGLKPNEGIVAVQVVTNAPRLSIRHERWTEVIAMRIDNIEHERAEAKKHGREKRWEPDIHILRPDEEGLIDNQVFIGTFPAGSYIITKLYSSYNDGTIQSYLSMPVGYAGGTFDVKAGQFTSLGSLVFQPLLNIKNPSFWSNESTGRAFVSRTTNLKDLNEYIIQKYPILKSTIDFSHPLTWNNDELLPFRQKLIDLITTNPYGDHAFKLQNFGNGLIATRFGILRWEDTEGRWHSTQLNTNVQISSVLEIGDLIVLAGERGFVFSGSSLNGPWKKYNPVSSSESIRWLGKTANNYFALTQSLDRSFVYEFDSLETPWNKIGDFKHVNSTFFSSGGLFPVLMKDGQIRIINDKFMYDYSPHEKSWIKSKGRGIKNLSQLENGALVANETSNWDGIGDQIISIDYGDTWLPFKRNLKILDNQYVNLSLPLLLDNTVISIGRNNINGKALELGDLQVITTTLDKISSKDTWQYIGLIPDSCTTLMPELSTSERLYFLCDQGSVIYTQDKGVTWKTAVSINIKSMQDTHEKLRDALNEKFHQEK